MWNDIRISKESANGDIWDLFHENAKSTRFSPVPNMKEVLNKMLSMSESFEYPHIKTTTLPKPRQDLPKGLIEAIENRRTPSNMRPKMLSLEDLSTLLHFSYGVTQDKEGTRFPRSFRASPSAGGLYPLEIFFHAAAVDGLEVGLYHYNPMKNQIGLIRQEDGTRKLSKAIVQQAFASRHSLMVFLTGVPGRMTFKYKDRGYRFMILEAGYVSSNLTLLSQSLGLCSMTIGGFYDQMIDDYLGIDGVSHSILSMLAIGEQAPGDARFS